MTTTDKRCTAFLAIAEACGRVHGAPLRGKGVLSIGDPDHGWHILLNTLDVKVDGLRPCCALVAWNGWPAGLIDPFGGWVAAGDAALIEWLETVAKGNPMGRGGAE